MQNRVKAAIFIGNELKKIKKRELRYLLEAWVQI